MKQGVVVSDLHMFAQRSKAHEMMSQIGDLIAKSDMLVLNGDTFDFRWTTLPSVDYTIKEAIDWIDGLSKSFPNCKIHVVCGNHDCRGEYLSALEDLIAKNASVSWYEHFMSMNNLLFLHGDCDTRHTKVDKFVHWSEPYETSKKVSRVLALAYDQANKSGLTAFAQKLASPPHKASKKVFSYMSEIAPDILEHAEHVYFGHSHVPFSNYEYNGLHFHNTGCAVSSMEFNPIHFRYED
ncbi:UDP-2,3-diacylglucosamine hydrolase [Desulfatibacillum alkenivorans DSM 16219]|jgi:UDP-2,3-diacylglucosamine hydrolase|uniref:UDP-2,3-diacylglucosamine hydrolase n=1 Tax=Desulfatibacillum alkenivorans DSM 16219 TaxID=1121393 RepID=A0A1M6ZEF7_9BACT|nr:metallophosphoesterase [Desulfatibacillum alkenivorans]SHL28891.1 UDP-2,3-diacylglucosamine hydrolase [Desulfatibacillum alkenivorans DSM 16219]